MLIPTWNVTKLKNICCIDTLTVRSKCFELDILQAFESHIPDLLNRKLGDIEFIYQHIEIFVTEMNFFYNHRNK